MTSTFIYDYLIFLDKVRKFTLSSQLIIPNFLNLKKS